jgi:MHS family proline/betaine transporter-like MFS transporter
MPDRTATLPVPAGNARLTKLIIATSLGNAMEFYNISIYAYFAIYISRAYFPSSNETIALLMTFGAFALSFVTRPIGAMVLGRFADTAGRKPGMLVCILLMFLGTAMVTFMPVYATIGILAPIGNLVARLIQGFAVGGQFGSATAFVVESAPERRGYMASWQFASQGAAGVLAGLFGVLLALYMPAAQLQAWGWRIPLGFGLLVGPIGLYILRFLEEPAGKGQPQQPGQTVLTTLFRQQKLRLGVAIGCLIISTAVNYLVIYLPTYTVKQLGMASSTGFAVSLVAYLILTVLSPMVGHLSDSLGRTRLMLIATIVLFFSFYLCFLAMTSMPRGTILFAVVIWLAIWKAVYYGALPALMSDLFPKATRATGLSLSYNLGVTLFGGLGPLAMMWLTRATGSNLAPAYYLMALAGLSFASLVVARRRYGIV